MFPAVPSAATRPCRCPARKGLMCCPDRVLHQLEERAPSLLDLAGLYGLDADTYVQAAMGATLSVADPLGVPAGWKLTTGRAALVPFSEAWARSLPGADRAVTFDGRPFSPSQLTAPQALAGLIAAAHQVVGGARLDEMDVVRADHLPLGPGGVLQLRSVSRTIAHVLSAPSIYRVWHRGLELSSIGAPVGPTAPTSSSDAGEVLTATSLLLSADRKLIVLQRGLDRLDSPGLWHATLSGAVRPPDLQASTVPGAVPLSRSRRPGRNAHPTLLDALDELTSDGGEPELHPLRAAGEVDEHSRATDTTLAALWWRATARQVRHEFGMASDLLVSGAPVGIGRDLFASGRLTLFGVATVAAGADELVDGRDPDTVRIIEVPADAAAAATAMIRVSAANEASFRSGRTTAQLTARLLLEGLRPLERRLPGR